MTSSAISRRNLVKQGSAALAGLSVLRLAGPARAFQENTGGEVIPWLDQPAENPVPDILPQQLDWEGLDDWLTPPDEFFVVKHFNLPELNPADWRLEISGLVKKPLSLSLDDLHARNRQDVTFTLECSGNSGLPFLTGAVGNATWSGTPLAPILEEAGVLEGGSEVVFWGADA
jgi:DMSO/TMAO reductase YedYZ molybdopterin-dependent catalytic subunit